MNIDLEKNLDFSGKIVLITGSTRGIGKATAERFSRYGAIVVINGRDEKIVQGVVNEIRNQGYRAEGIVADLTRRENLASLAKSVEGRFGKIDSLVNCAGITTGGIIEESGESDWDAVIATNLTAMYMLSRFFVPLMKGRKSGSILNVASQAALNGPMLSGGSSYAASKGGVISFTKSLAREVGPFNIRVNAVMPGLIETDMTTGFIYSRKEEYDKLIKTIPLQRHGFPQEVADVCVFLASDMASYITGEVLAVNGGLPSILYL